MSMLIPGLSLPPKGKIKMFVLFDDGVLLDNNDGQNFWQAVELPSHGRLIDADADSSEYVTVWDCDCSEFGKQTVMAVDDLNYLPTIIPAEGGADR